MCLNCMCILKSYRGTLKISLFYYLTLGDKNRKKNTFMFIYCYMEVKLEITEDKIFGLHGKMSRLK